MSLEKLRERLSQLDREFLRLASERQAVVKEIGQEKRGKGIPTRDFEREKEVLQQGRSVATEYGLPPDLAEALLRLLIESSLTTQEHARVSESAYGSGKRALVIGGSGRIGRWFVEFLASQGFAVEVADPQGGVPGFSHFDDWQTSPLDQDLIVVAAPLRITASILSGLAARKPAGLVFDVGSLKTPLRPGLDAMRAAGCRVTSLHPMFGPDTELLSGRHVIFVDLGVPEATRQAKELFTPTMALQVDMGLDDHDRLIAYVLGLSHALNIAFFTALAESGEARVKLAQLSSTTFDAQLDVASKVADENPHLYFEIQSLNQHNLGPLADLGEAVQRLRALVEGGDEQGFVNLMNQGRGYLAARTANDERRG